MALSTHPANAGARAGDALVDDRRTDRPAGSDPKSQGAFEPSSTLKSRSFIGLVLSQFLAAFNDQASHIVAFFYATNMLVYFVGLPHVDTKAVVSIVTACFITPFFLFSPLAGVLADKYSKRSIIVFWKLAEVAIMALALVGFLLPHAASLGWASQQTLAVASSVILVAVVFLMGTHSAFFIPAKYGMMPEILHTSILSRGNGVLEGSSFLANIFGTVVGGLVYYTVKSKIEVTGGVYSLQLGREWLVGLLLFLLALVGAAVSFIIERVPAAAPEKKLIFEPYTPMKQNLHLLRKSRSLVLATIGIAFFLFMTLYLRQSLLFQGETIEEIELAKAMLPNKPVTASTEEVIAQVEGAAESSHSDALGIADVVTSEEPTAKAPAASTKTEFEVAILIGLIGLGVGIGCSLAGYFSGNRLELGLVPIGIVLLIITTAIMAIVVPAKFKMMGGLVAIGAAAGLYIVPLYTLLQHRSPKESKGSLVATSNFLNVTGGLIAVLVFFFVTSRLQAFLGITLNIKAVKQQPDLVTAYLHQLDRALQIPKMLFLFASLITLAMLVLMWWQRPDFMLRAISWVKSKRRRHLRALGLDNIPANGQVILISNSHDLDHWIHVVSTVDRFTRFVAPPDATGDKLLRDVALSSGVMIAANRKVRLSAEDNALARGLVTLGQGYILGLSLAKDFAADTGPCAGEHLLSELRAKVPATLLPVYCGENPTHPEALRHPELHTYVVIGKPLPSDTTLDSVRAAVAALGN